MKPSRWQAGLLGLTLGTSVASAAADTVQWPDTPAARDAAKARIEELQQALMRQPSATLVLSRWCATYHLAAAPKIVARRVPGPDKPLPRNVWLNLRLKPGEAVGYRRVQLLCGDRILSDADNWYVPDRLTLEMNRRLDHSDTPFGLAVRSLHFERRTLSSERLWAPDTPGSVMVVPDHLLRNEGLLTIDGGVPISQVIETYTSAILGTPP